MTPMTWQRKDGVSYMEYPFRFRSVISGYDDAGTQHVTIVCDDDSMLDEIHKLLTEGAAETERLKAELAQYAATIESYFQPTILGLQKQIQEVMARRDEKARQLNEHKAQQEKLAKELAEAERQRNIECESSRRLEAQLDDLRERVKPLVEALQKYADLKTYDVSSHCKQRNIDYCRFPGACHAIKALETWDAAEKGTADAKP